MTNKLAKIDRRRKAVLILECDSGKLTQQNLAVGSELERVATKVFPQNPIKYIKSFTEAELLKTIAALYETGQLFRSIVIIGHSDRNGLQIASDRFNKWSAVANWISPFKPHRVILLACEAGQSLSCAALFDGIPTLKEAFGSPINANKNQQYIVLARVLYVLGAKKENPFVNQLMQLANVILTQGVMLSRTRNDYENG